VDAVVLEAGVQVVGVVLVDRAVVIDVGVIALIFLVMYAGDDVMEVVTVELATLVDVDREAGHVDVVGTPTREHHRKAKDDPLHACEWPAAPPAFARARSQASEPVTRLMAAISSGIGAGFGMNASMPSRSPGYG